MTSSDAKHILIFYLKSEKESETMFNNSISVLTRQEEDWGFECSGILRDLWLHTTPAKLYRETVGSLKDLSSLQLGTLCNVFSRH